MISLIPKDKLLHIGAGALAGLVVLVFTSNPLAAFMVAVAAGVLKEVYDHASNQDAADRGEPPQHDVDLWDAIATAAGGLVVALVWVGMR